MASSKKLKLSNLLKNMSEKIFRHIFLRKLSPKHYFSNSVIQIWYLIFKVVLGQRQRGGGVKTYAPRRRMIMHFEIHAVYFFKNTCADIKGLAK